jgi:hypothetical protein
MLSRAVSAPTSGSRETLKAHMPCRLHQQQLIVVLLLATAGQWILSRLYSLTLLMRGGGATFRMAMELKLLINNTATVSYDPPPPGTNAFLQEVKAYVLANKRRFRPDLVKPTRQNPKGL